MEKTKIKAVFSEAPAHAGMGMPDDIKVPLVLIFGKEDTYGTPVNNTGLRWLHNGSCRLNVYIPEAPKGSSRKRPSELLLQATNSFSPLEAFYPLRQAWSGNIFYELYILS